MRAAPTARVKTAQVKVWDRLVRSLHWLLVLTVLYAWASGHWPVLGTRIAKQDAHELAGYAAAAIVALRLLWGFCGSPYARFAQFVRGPRATWDYFRLLLARREPRTLGHNPLGAWMIVALLACVGIISLSGFLYTTDWLYGYAWLEALHAAFAWVLAALVCGHLAGVLFTSLRHRENLVLSMINGTKPAGETAAPWAREE